MNERNRQGGNDGLSFFSGDGRDEYYIRGKTFYGRWRSTIDGNAVGYLRLNIND